MRNYVSKEVVCPFYRQEELDHGQNRATKIRCEGFCKACSFQISFGRREELINHKERHCNSFEGFPKCPLYPVINKQYED